MSIRYSLDKRRSRFTVKVHASGLLSGLGHNPTMAIRNFSGHLDFDPDDPQECEFEMVVQANSLEVTDDVKKKDRQEIEGQMRDDVLEVSKYPEITFKSTEILVEDAGSGTYTAQIIGDLSLHGVTREQQIDARVKARPDEVSLGGEFTLNQSSHGIKRVSALAGTLKVKDELQFSFDIKGFKE